MRPAIKTLAILLSLLTSCQQTEEQKLNFGVTIDGVPGELLAKFGNELTIGYDLLAEDGLSLVKILEDGLEKEETLFAGEKSLHREYTFTENFSLKNDPWAEGPIDSLVVVIFAKDTDGDSDYVKTTVRLQPD